MFRLQESLWACVNSKTRCVIGLGAIAACVAVCGGVMTYVLARSVILSGHTSDVNSVAFSSDGKLLASGSYDTTIGLWDVQTKTEVGTLEPPEGRYLGPEKSRGTVYDPVFGKTPPFVRSVQFSADGKTLASGADDDTVRLWSTDTRRQLLKIELEPSGPHGRGNQVFGVAFAPDGKSVASASFDGVLRFWSVEGGKLLYSLKGHTDVIYAVVFSPDGKTLASCGADRTIRVWDAESQETKMVLRAHMGYVRSVAFSPDGRLLASGGGDVHGDGAITELKLWDLSSGKEVANLVGPKAPVHSVAFSVNGKVLSSGGGSAYAKYGELILWDLATRKELTRLKGHNNLVLSVAFSPDGKLLATGSADKTIKLWNVEKYVGR